MTDTCYGFSVGDFVDVDQGAFMSERIEGLWMVSKFEGDMMWLEHASDRCVWMHVSRCTKASNKRVMEVMRGYELKLLSHWVKEQTA